MKCVLIQAYVNISAVALHYCANLKGKNHKQIILIVRPIKKPSC